MSNLIDEIRASRECLRRLESETSEASVIILGSSSARSPDHAY